MSTPILDKRTIDLKTAAYKSAQQFNNLDGGLWEKYSTNGIAAPTGDAVITDKPSDTDVYDIKAIAAIFDREAYGKAYVDSLANSEAASNTMNSKLQSDTLSSMQQSMSLRYTSRIRSCCAALSRRLSIARTDMDIYTAVNTK